MRFLCVLSPTNEVPDLPPFDGTIDLRGAGFRLRCAAPDSPPVTISHATDDETGLDCIFCGYLAREAGDPAKKIVREYLKRGPAAFDQNGIYAIITMDRRNRRFHVCVDKYGLFPLFWARQGSNWLISNDFGAISRIAARRLCVDGIEEELAFGAPLQARTFYEEVSRLQSAECLTVATDGSWRSSRYWSFASLDYHGGEDFDDFIDGANDRFGAVISNLAGRMSQPVCFLSAGYDSRRIYLELRRQGFDPHTATVEDVAKPFGSKTVEGAIVRQLVAGTSAQHLFADPPELSRLRRCFARQDAALAGQAIEHEWVCPLLDRIEPNWGTNLDGLTGDRLFNYPLTGLADGNNIARMPVMDMAAALINDGARSYLSEGFLNGASAPLIERVANALEELPDNPNRLSLLLVLTRGHKKIAPFATRLLAEKLSTVFPYYDDDVVAHALGFSPIWKERHRLQRMILDRMSPDYAAVPSSHTPGDEVDPNLLRDLTHLNGKGRRASRPYSQLVLEESIAHACRLLTSNPAVREYLSPRGRSLARVGRAWPLICRWFRSGHERFWAAPGLGQLALIVGRLHES